MRSKLLTYRLFQVPLRGREAWLVAIVAEALITHIASAALKLGTVAGGRRPVAVVTQIY